MDLSRYIFWDVDFGAIDWEKHRRFVIQRVISKGSLEDWKKIIEFYGPEKVKKALTRERYLDKKTLNFSSYYFQVPKEEFRCYNSIPSGQKLWNY